MQAPLLHTPIGPAILFQFVERTPFWPDDFAAATRFLSPNCAAFSFADLCSRARIRNSTSLAVDSELYVFLVSD